MTEKQKYFFLIFLMFIVTSALGQRDNNLVFMDWDKNNDNLISRSEFNEVFYRYYTEDWSMKDMEYLDDEDFFTSLYAMWDADGDKLLTKEEHLQGYDVNYSEYAQGDFVAVDDDNNGFIEYDEFYEVMNDSGYFKDWDVDADGYLNKYELARYVFNNWDKNNSNFIDPEEYVYFDVYFSDF